MKRKPDEYNEHKEDNCVACGDHWPMLDIDHVKTIGSGGTNDPWNCMTLCRFCHIKKDQKGIVWMTNTFPNYKNWLIKNGWEFDKYLGKWRHYD